jgi:preprotein translocase subunit YajC
VNYVSLLVPLLLIAGLLYFSTRARRRQAAAEADRSGRINVGSEVMTTSGLHATVVAKNSDGTAQLSIAPGVEVRWEIAALRDVASLPDRYRRTAGGSADDSDLAAPGGTSGAPGTSGVQLSKEE